MNLDMTPQLLAEMVMLRSTCNVQVGAVIADSHGVFSWFWNHVGNGMGAHAEAEAIRRANRKRLKGAEIYVASQWIHSGNISPSLPCPACMKKINAVGIYGIHYRIKSGRWVYLTCR